MKKFILTLLALCLAVFAVSCGKPEEAPVISKAPPQFSAPPAQIISPELSITAFGNRGNSGGNIVNGGFSAAYRDKLFFSDSSLSGCLALLDSNGLRRLTDFPVSGINTYENWIYFCNANASNCIYKCRTDGNELTVVTGVGAAYPQVVGNWIYFSSLSDGGKLYRVSVDGNQLEKICDDSAADINAYPETVYYKNTSDNSSLYHICTDGTDRGRIIKKNCGSFNAYGVYLFYIDLSDGRIYRSSFDGMYIKNLGQQASCINVLENRVYFSNSEGIFRMDFDGENCEKLAQNPADKISVIGSTVYYVSRENGGLYALYTDENGAAVNEPLAGTYYSAG